MKLRWDDLETILEVWRAGTQERAAAALALDQATVSRRIARLEQAAEVKIFVRRGGRLVPTAAGEIFLTRLTQVDEAVVAARTALATAGSIAETTVRIAAPQLLIDHVLAPALGSLPRRYPGLKLDLATRSAAARPAGDCDLVLSLSEPEETGGTVRRVARMPYRIYAPAARPEIPAWVGLLPGAAAAPEVDWLDENVGRASIVVRVDDLSTAVVAVAGGVGKAVLPVFIGRLEPAVTPVSDVVLRRDIWLAVQDDSAAAPPVGAARRWIDEALVAVHLGND